MKHVLSVLALAAASVVAASAAHAVPVTERAVLSGPAESPPNTSPGSSVAAIEIDGTILRVDVPFKDLVADATMAHIHCCTPSALTGTASIALPFTDFPTGVTAGTYNHAFDLTSDTVYTPAFLAANGGTASGASAALLAGIEANEAYVNIHTTENPGGEIRGFLVAAPVPEPGSWAMLGFGLAGLGVMARRRRG